MRQHRDSPRRGAASRPPVLAASIVGWAAVIGITMSTEFLAQPFVWRNWPLLEVMAGWLNVAGDRLMVAGAIAACLIAADSLKPSGSRGRNIALACAVVVGAVAGEALRLAADPFADRADAPAIIGRIAEWMLIGAAGVGILVTWRLGTDLATDVADTAFGEARLRRMKTAFELTALQRQIEPHFLFNTLATVKRFSQTAPAEGQTLVERLHDYVSTTLDTSRRSRSNFGDELDLVLAYLDVCAARMGPRLTVINAVDPGLRDLGVPPLMLGTLVENAVRHGLAPRAGGGTLTLAATLSGDALEIAVCDDGIGLTAESGHGIGLSNLVARLDLMYGRRASLRLTAMEPHGVKALLRLPREPVER